MGSKEAFHAWLAQLAEHQTKDLAVTGSTPVPPTAGCEPAPPWPEGGGRLTDRPMLARMFAEPGDFRTAIMGWPGLNLIEAICVQQWQHKQVPCSARIPLPAASGKAAAKVR